VLTAEKKMKNNGSKDPWIYSCCTLCNTKSRERAQGLVSFVDYSQEIQLKTGRLSCVCWMYSTARLAASTHTGQITGNPPDEKAN
jgi:hypothetical protein